jgi:hypothetical protein
MVLKTRHVSTYVGYLQVVCLHQQTHYYHVSTVHK